MATHDLVTIQIVKCFPTHGKPILLQLVSHVALNISNLWSYLEVRMPEAMFDINDNEYFQLTVLCMCMHKFF